VPADFFTVGKDPQRTAALHGSVLQGSVYARKVQIAAIAAMANGLWTSQIGRNLTDGISGFLTGKRYLIHDRDPLFTAEFLKMLADAGVKSVKLRRVHLISMPTARQIRAVSKTSGTSGITSPLLGQASSSTDGVVK
jgi:hypothetical protein